MSLEECRRLAEELVAAIDRYNVNDYYWREEDHKYQEEFKRIKISAEVKSRSASNQYADIAKYISELEAAKKDWLNKADALEMFSLIDIMKACFEGKTPDGFGKIKRRRKKKLGVCQGSGDTT